MSDISKKVDILCLCNTHGIGGAQLNAAMLAENFSRRGLKTAVGFLFEREVEFKHGNTDHFIISSTKPRTPKEWFGFFSRLRREINLRQPRAIIGFQPAGNVLGAIAALVIGNCRLVATQRNPSQQQSRVGALLDKYIGATPLYHNNIAVSHSVSSTYAKYPTSYRKKLRVVHNATPQLPAVDKSKTDCRIDLNIPLEVKVIGCIGRLHPQKNIGFALEAFSLLPSSYNLCIAGYGPEESKLRQQARDLKVDDRVLFLGSLSGENITKFYKAIDLLLFSSIYEGFGRVLVEAMSQGVPIVSSNIDIAREVALDAAVFCDFDPAQWSLAIERLLENNLAHADLARKGIIRAQKFDVESMVNKYIDASLN